MRIFSKQNKVLIVFILIIFLISFLYSRVVEYRVSIQNGITIVLDAGHGGRDGGSVGFNGTIEKEINLEYVKALKEKFVQNGFKVILTRKNDDGLYSEFSKNKKQSDMKGRLKIIKQANPNLVISLHMNSFKDKNAKGAVTYYRQGDESGKQCASFIQKSLNASCDARFTEGKVGDFFMVNSSYYTMILVECGFISNPEEEKKLNSEEYKNKVVEAIYKGVLLYFGNKQI